MSDNDCGGAHSCANPQQFKLTMWARQLTDASGAATPGAGWVQVRSECLSVRPEPSVSAPPQPQVTDAVVLAAVRELGLPRLTVQVQPAGDTLVHLDTIFYTEVAGWARAVRLLGHDVQVQAAPAGYWWRFGDGTTVQTAGPGAPYPAMEVTHAYTDAGVRVAPRVDTAYEVSYQVDGGGWQTIHQTVPATGLPGSLRVREGVPTLVGSD